MKPTRKAALLAGGVALAGALFAFSCLVADGESGRSCAHGHSSGGTLAAGALPAPRSQRRSSGARRTAAARVSCLASNACALALRGAEAMKPGSKPDGTPGAVAPSHTAKPPSAAASRRSLTAEQRRKLADALAQVDWNQALKDLAQAMKDARANGTAFDPTSSLEATNVKAALAAAASALGLKSPAAALGDPEVRSVVVPAWLNALGVNLDAAQAEQISLECTSLPPSTSPDDATYLAARQTALQSRIALEQTLTQVLTPEQQATYAANVLTADPLAKAGKRMVLSAGSPDQLATTVAAYWANVFQLDPGSQAAAQTVAQSYVAAVLAVPPVGPNLGAEGTRVASLARTSQLIALQQQAEQTLAVSPALTPDQQSLAASGSPSALRLGISR